MLHWYLLRKGSSLLIVHLSHRGVLLWHKEGWEGGARPFETLAEAEQERQRSQEQLTQASGGEPGSRRKPPEAEERTAKDDTGR
jgi:hypothetical protein